MSGLATAPTTAGEGTPTPPPLRIACVAWGSLLWKPGELPLAGDWQPGGPPLPLEFARVGDLGELAIVLCDGAPDAPTYWAELAVDDVDQARELLRRRERIEPAWAGLVGSLPADDADEGPWHPRIAAWARAQGLDGVVWTALPPKSPGGASAVPTADEAVAYLRALQDERAGHAESYVRRVPADIRTPYRQVIEERLGWTPQPQAVAAD